MARTGAMRAPLRESDWKLPVGGENRIRARSERKVGRDRGLRLEVLPGQVAVQAHAVPPAHFRLVKGFVVVMRGQRRVDGGDDMVYHQTSQKIRLHARIIVRLVPHAYVILLHGSGGEHEFIILIEQGPSVRSHGIETRVRHDYAVGIQPPRDELLFLADVFIEAKGVRKLPAYGGNGI